MDIEQIVGLAYKYTPNIFFGSIIFLFFWFFSKIVQYGIKKILKTTNPNTNISNVIAGIVKNLIVILGFITALGTLGINISAIVAGLGLTGFAFGFAFKDMLSNFISGVMLFIYQPFGLGDTISVDGKEGKVVDINLRYVTLENEDLKMLVPNSLLVSKSLEIKKTNKE
tara:strand:+ start:66 stop:572 length:507 start_codon:yes stop_codon:yes gene_type:complete